MSLPARAVFVLLMGATFAAFFVAQRLKGGPPVAQLTYAARAFSPDGDGRKDVLALAVRVPADDDLTLTVIDRAGDRVRRLATGVTAQGGKPVRAEWDGRTDAGARAPDGRYRLRVGLRSAGRALTLVPGFRVDTVAPAPTVLVGGDGDRDWITGPVAGRVEFRVRRTARGRATAIRVLRTDTRDEPVPVALFELPAGVRTGAWDGHVQDAPAPSGAYVIEAAVRDAAGNVGRSVSARPRPGGVRGLPGVSVRTLLARPPADPVRAGRRARFAVDSRGRPYRWTLRRVGASRPVRRGSRAGGGELIVRTPGGASGLYLLEVQAGRDRTAVPLAVQATRGAPLLVVLPAITWFGADPLDDDRDGFPNTLARGGPASWPRLLAGGLPAGVATQVAPLLVFLDRQGIRYDLTTDLALAATRSALSPERRGVLLAGPLRWVPTDLAKRLRRYSADGGRMAVLGTDTLRRGVDVASTRLLRPTQPTETDAFGTRVRPLRRLPAGAGALQPVADEGATGLLTGVQDLPGFGLVEEGRPAGRVLAALAQVDATAQAEAEAAGTPLPPSVPAVSLSRVGRGTVVRIGLPEWGERLAAREPQVQQLTRNVADLLRGLRPRIRSFPEG